MKDGAAELQRVLENAAIHAGPCELPQEVFDGTAISDQVSVRFRVQPGLCVHAMFLGCWRPVSKPITCRIADLFFAV